MRELNVNEIEIVVGGFKKDDKGSNHKKKYQKLLKKLGPVGKAAGYAWTAYEWLTEDDEGGKEEKKKD